MNTNPLYAIYEIAGESRELACSYDSLADAVLSALETCWEEIDFLLCLPLEIVAETPDTARIEATVRHLVKHGDKPSGVMGVRYRDGSHETYFVQYTDGGPALIERLSSFRAEPAVQPECEGR